MAKKICPLNKSVGQVEVKTSKEKKSKIEIDLLLSIIQSKSIYEIKINPKLKLLAFFVLKKPLSLKDIIKN